LNPVAYKSLDEITELAVDLQEPVVQADGKTPNDRAAKGGESRDVRK
jgi:hypothetical protein